MRAGATLIDLTGRRFGRWTVLGRDIERDSKAKCLKPHWLCVCDCNAAKCWSVQGANLRNKISMACCDCRREGNKRHGAGWRALWAHIVAGARHRKILLSVTAAEAFALLEAQQFRCALSNLPIAIPPRAQYGNDYTASLDRKDSSSDYRLNNVQWVHKNLQGPKHCLSNDDFIAMCCAVADHARRHGRSQEMETQ